MKASGAVCESLSSGTPCVSLPCVTLGCFPSRTHSPAGAGGDAPQWWTTDTASIRVCLHNTAATQAQKQGAVRCSDTAITPPQGVAVQSTCSDCPTGVLSKAILPGKPCWRLYRRGQNAVPGNHAQPRTWQTVISAGGERLAAPYNVQQEPDCTLGRKHAPTSSGV